MLASGLLNSDICVTPVSRDANIGIRPPESYPAFWQTTRKAKGPNIFYIPLSAWLALYHEQAYG